MNLVKQSFPDKKLLLTADRGFGRAGFIAFLLKKEVLFVLRVKSDVSITTHGGEKHLLRTLGKTLAPEIPQWYEKITYRSDGLVAGVNLAAIVAPLEAEGKDPDPWFLITNLLKPETTIARYGERFHIEEWFKDFKHQLGIAKLQTRNLMRVRRLVFVSAVGYGIAMLVGTLASRYHTVQDRLITGGKKSASRIWFALKIIKYKLLGTAFWRKVYAQAASP